jgi:hypothetical protein
VKKSNQHNARDRLTKEIFAQVQDRVKFGLDKFQTLFWQNPRPHELGGGWRLSEAGFSVLTELDYKYYPINLPVDMVVSGQTLIHMDRYLDGPWYLMKGVLYCFNEKTAFQLILFSGDVAQFGRSREQSGRML